jgi:hypothetical protein
MKQHECRRRALIDVYAKDICARQDRLLCEHCRESAKKLAYPPGGCMGPRTASRGLHGIFDVAAQLLLVM